MSALRPLAGDAVTRVGCAYHRIELADRPEVWITLRPRSDVLAEAAVLDARVAAGEDLPLAGRLVAVKDNIDVAGLPTTAGCPEFAYRPAATATAVQRLVDAGAIVLGKTNLDQFATGLVGTRSPYGAVGSAADPDRIAGGSSSGSAVAVALGIADIGIGTDTAGSGRVPAAFNGLVGIKATLGVVPTTGVVPACADFDCVTVLAADLATATAAIAAMTGPDPADPRSRSYPADAPAGAAPDPVIAVPRDVDLAALSPAYATAFAAAVDALHATGVTVRTVDITPLLAAARLLYDGAFVAQRYAAVGEFLELSAEAADPVVAGIVLGARDITAVDYLRDTERLLRHRQVCRDLLADCDALFLPTTTEQPTLEDISADPVGINKRLGTFTNFANLLDLVAVAVPGGALPDGAPFGVMVVAPAFHDQIAVDIAARFTGQPAGPQLVGAVPLAVFGAHLSGQPLNGQLLSRGAVLRGPVRTTDAYRLYALPTTPGKPGLIRAGEGLGAPIAGELWAVPPAGLGTLLAELPPPMSLTPVQLADGRWVVGFGCAHDAIVGAPDITDTGSWAVYLRRAG